MLNLNTLMFLSNAVRLSFLCTCLLAASCSPWQKSDTSVNDFPTPDNIPFSTAEPNVFQCDVVRSNGETEQKTFFARKGGNLRFDINTDEYAVHSDKDYRINNKMLIYSEIPSGDASAAEPEFINDLTIAALKQTADARFELIGKAEGQTRYNVILGPSEAAKAVIYIDDSSGLIVREEFFSLKGPGNASERPAFVFELRGLKMEVDDAAFAIPAGYKKLAWKDYLAAIAK